MFTFKHLNICTFIKKFQQSLYSVPYKTDLLNTVIVFYCKKNMALKKDVVFFISILKFFCHNSMEYNLLKSCFLHAKKHQLYFVKINISAFISSYKT